MSDTSLVDQSHLEQLYAQSSQELETVQSDISKLEEHLHELVELKQRARQLETLRYSLGHMLKSPESPLTLDDLVLDAEKSTATPSPRAHSSRKHKSYTIMQKEAPLPDYTNGVFIPEKAFEDADHILTHRQSINYEFFRAIVLNGGHASTRDIRDYLIDNKIKTQNGKGFEDSKLSEISARVAYLVKKGVIRAIAPGRFLSCFGWSLGGDA